MKPGRYIVVLDVNPNRKKHLMWDKAALLEKLLTIELTGEYGPVFTDCTVYSDLEDLREAVQDGSLNLVEGPQWPEEKE